MSAGDPAERARDATGEAGHGEQEDGRDDPQDDGVFGHRLPAFAGLAENQESCQDRVHVQVTFRGSPSPGMHVSSNSDFEMRYRPFG